MMKYYLYVSDAKVDMLIAQIPHDTRQRIANEFKIDLKIVSASRKTDRTAGDNRFARLETVVGYIREYGNVGSVDEPDEYIEGSLRMQRALSPWGRQPARRCQTPPYEHGSH